VKEESENNLMKTKGVKSAPTNSLSNSDVQSDFATIKKEKERNPLHSEEKEKRKQKKIRKKLPFRSHEANLIPRIGCE
jgi:hypothetical protein